jgi:hypothetical protein
MFSSRRFTKPPCQPRPTRQPRSLPLQSLPRPRTAQ